MREISDLELQSFKGEVFALSRENFVSWGRVVPISTNQYGMCIIGGEIIPLDDGDTITDKSLRDFTYRVSALRVS